MYTQIHTYTCFTPMHLNSLNALGWRLIQVAAGLWQQLEAPRVRSERRSVGEHHERSIRITVILILVVPDSEIYLVIDNQYYQESLISLIIHR